MPLVLRSDRPHPDAAADTAGPLRRAVGALALGLALLALAGPGAAQTAGKDAEPAAIVAPGAGSDIPAHLQAVTTANDHVKRAEMIPMRDGVKLYTVIVVPKGARDAPILFTRTPYNAKQRADGRRWARRAGL